MPRRQKKYHYIYKTINILNDKFYIGMHSTDNLDDGYMGSGKRLWYSINKHGKENHVCEILEYLPDRVSLKIREKEIVDEELLNEELCMNLVIGGNGGFDKINDSSPAHIERCKRGRASCDKILSEKYGYDFHKNLGKLGANGHTSASRNVAGKNALDTIIARYGHGYTLGIKHSTATKKKIGAANSEHQRGKNNSQYGTCWIYSETEQTNKKIPKRDLQLYINNGWIRGRKIKF